MSNLTDFFRLFENKDRLIDKLDLTDEQKAELKDFFQKHPNYENKIDWNRKDLTYNDFEELLKLEGNTKSSQKKYGLSGKAQIEDLVEGKDYEVLVDKPNLTVYYPRNFKASEVLAKPTTAPEGITGKWCIAGKNYSPGTQDQHWKRYTQERHIDFFFVFMEHRKYAVARYPQDLARPSGDPRIDIFDQNDNQVTEIWDSNDFYSKVHLNLDWLKKLMAEQPNKLISKKEVKVQGAGYTLSEDGQTLMSIDRNLTRLVIPEGVTEIARGAGFAHTNLQQLVIPATVKKIGFNAFTHCTGLQKVSITLAPGEDSLSTTDYHSVPFGKCTGSLDIIATGKDDNPSQISYALFTKSSFKDIQIIGQTADSRFVIMESAFSDCKALENLTIGEGCTEIYNEAFFNCENLKAVFIPSTVTWLGMEVFSHCKNIRTFEFAKGSQLGAIDTACFYDNAYVTKIEIPDGCSQIAEQGFCELPSLRELVVPASMKYFGTPLVVIYNSGYRGEEDEEDYEPYDYLFDRDDQHSKWPKNLHVTYKGTKAQWKNLIQYFTKDEKQLLSNVTCLGDTP